MLTRKLPTAEVLEDRIRELLTRLYNVGGMARTARVTLEHSPNPGQPDVYAASCTLEELETSVNALSEGFDPVNLLATEAPEREPLPERQEFRRDQRGEFMAALEASMQTGGFVLDVQETDGQTVAVIRREQVPA